MLLWPQGSVNEDSEHAALSSWARNAVCGQSKASGPSPAERMPERHKERRERHPFVSTFSGPSWFSECAKPFFSSSTLPFPSRTAAAAFFSRHAVGTSQLGFERTVVTTMCNGEWLPFTQNLVASLTANTGLRQGQVGAWFDWVLGASKTLQFLYCSGCGTCDFA